MGAHLYHPADHCGSRESNLVNLSGLSAKLINLTANGGKTVRVDERGDEKQGLLWSILNIRLMMKMEMRIL